MIVGVRAGAEAAQGLCGVPVRDTGAVNAVTPAVAIGHVDATTHALSGVDGETPVCVGLA